MIGSAAARPGALPCATGKYWENHDFMPEIDRISARGSLQIKHLRDEFPMRANRELIQPNREAKSA
jgi:hypothetical protein